MTPLTQMDLTQMDGEQATAEPDQAAQRDRIIAWTRRHGQETLRNAWRAAEKGESHKLSRS